MKIVPRLFTLLSHEKVTVRKECCWILSNITAGSSQQIGQVFSEIERFKKLIKISIEDSEDIAREAIWTISNATAHSTSKQIKSLIDA